MLSKHLLSNRCPPESGPQHFIITSLGEWELPSTRQSFILKGLQRAPLGLGWHPLGANSSEGKDWTWTDCASVLSKLQDLQDGFHRFFVPVIGGDLLTLMSYRNKFKNRGAYLCLGKLRKVSHIITQVTVVSIGNILRSALGISGSVFMVVPFHSTVVLRATCSVLKQWETPRSFCLCWLLLS